MTNLQPHASAVAEPAKSGELTGSARRAFEAIFQHPLAHNLEWSKVVMLMEKIGRVQRRTGNEFLFDVGGARHIMHKPHTKDLTSDEVLDLRHFLQKTGWSSVAGPDFGVPPVEAAPALLIVVDHRGAKIYGIATTMDDDPKSIIGPYESQHLMHHLERTDRYGARDLGTSPDTEFFKTVAEAVAGGGRLVLIGHGTGNSNVAVHLAEFLRSHHPDTYARIVSEQTADLSSVTPRQLMALAHAALG